MPDPSLTRIAVRLTGDADPELTLVQATAIVGSGCQERDGGRELLFWAPRESSRRLVQALGALAGVAGVDAEDADGSWRDALRTFHQPIRVAGRLLVRPPWVDPEPALGDVVIDPGMAFGTGQHATTQGCLELVCGLEPEGAVLDVGCGSGVLAIAARRLGFGPVTAYDFDPLCVDATLANARANGVALTVARRTLGEDPLPATPTLLANLTSGLLEALAREVTPRPPRAAIISGLRPSEAPRVLRAWAPAGLREADRREADDWAAILLRA